MSDKSNKPKKTCHHCGATTEYDAKDQKWHPQGFAYIVCSKCNLPLRLDTKKK